MVIFLNENISNILGFVSLAFICELKNLSDNSEWLTLLFNFFKNIASKDAYFGLLGTIIGAILGSHLTRIAERRRSKNHILL